MLGRTENRLWRSFYQLLSKWQLFVLPPTINMVYILNPPIIEDMSSSEFYWDDNIVIKVCGDFSAPINDYLYRAIKICAG
jgi:hypothetical protein